MPVQRKRFRIEEVAAGPTMADGAETNFEPMPHHDEILTELRAIRAQMGNGSRPHVTAATTDDAEPQELTDLKATLETYRAQIEQCDKLKVELDLIHEAINRTKMEIAVLHGKSFDGGEMAKVTGELGAVVGGTEEATQQILEAAEAIDQAASALTKVQSADQQARLAEDILERGDLDFRGLQFPGPDRTAHLESSQHDEVHRASHRRDDGHLGWRRCHQGGLARDRR